MAGTTNGVAQSSAATTSVQFERKEPQQRFVRALRSRAIDLPPPPPPSAVSLLLLLWVSFLAHHTSPTTSHPANNLTSYGPAAWPLGGKRCSVYVARNPRRKERRRKTEYKSRPKRYIVCISFHGWDSFSMPLRHLIMHCFGRLGGGGVVNFVI